MMGTESIIPRTLFALFSIVLLTQVLGLVQKKKLELRHGLVWLVAMSGSLLFCVFPNLLEWLAHRLGFAIPSNFIMSFAILMLLGIVFLQTLSLGKAKKNLRDLAQRQALLEEQWRRKTGV